MIIKGTAATEILIGSAGNDTFFGLGGNDTMQGLAGLDTLSFADPEGAPASAVSVVADLSAGRVWSGADTLVLVSVENVMGSAAGDWIRGNDDQNSLYGAAGDDVLIAVGSGDQLDGGAGNDALYGADGADVLSGGDGIDWVQAGAGDDVLLEFSNNAGEWSALHGEGGNDTFLISGLGSNGAWGGDGSDTIKLMGYGIIYAHGGAGADVFAVTSSALSHDGDGFMQVFDFEPGVDKLHADVFNQPGTVTEILDWGPNTGVRFSDAYTGASAVIMLMDVTSSEIDAVRDFILT